MHDFLILPDIFFVNYENHNLFHTVFVLNTDSDDEEYVVAVDLGILFKRSDMPYNHDSNNRESLGFVEE